MLNWFSFLPLSYDSTWTDIKYYHFATIYGFNIFTVGLLTAWLVKINYKPKILVSHRKIDEQIGIKNQSMKHSIHAT